MSGPESIRPSIPQAWWAATGLWAGVWLAEALAWQAFAEQGGPTRTLLTVALIAGFAIVAMTRRHRSALLLAGLAAGVACGSLFWWRCAQQVSFLDEHAPSVWEGEVVGDATSGAFGESSTVRVAAARGSMLVRVGWPRDSRAPEAGSRCEFFGSYRALGSDEQGRRKFRQGVVGSVSARRVRGQASATSLRGLVRPWRHRWLELVEQVPGDGGALLAGVVLGERSRMTDTSAEAAFRTTGLTHLVAVSGGHLVVVAALVTWLLTRLRTRRAVLVCVVVAITGAYVVLSGVQPSAVRAWLMSVVVAIALLSGRRADGLAALAGAVWIALVTGPSAAFDLGMQLSVLSVAGLLLFARFAEGWVTQALPGVARKLASPVALTLVAQAFTVPLTVPVFGVVSLVSPIANLLVSPLVSVLLVMGIAGLGMAMLAERAGVAILRLAGHVGALACRVAEWLASWPHAAVPLGWSAAVASIAAIVLTAGVWLAWPRPSRRRARMAAVLAIAALLALSVGFPVRHGAQIVVLDIGQGDAILVRDGSAAVLIDTGPDEAALRAALLRQGVRRLDALVITHLHDDHYGGIGALEGVIPVSRVLVPDGTRAKEPERCAEFARVGEVGEVGAPDTLTVGRWRLSVVWPRAPVPDPATNEASVVMTASLGSLDALLTGDAESPVLESVLAAGGLGDIEVMKVGHHASAVAVDQRILALTRPEYALVSVGAGNRYGHPVASTVQQLEHAGALFMRTDTMGDLVVDTDGTRFVVSASRERSKPVRN